MNKKTRKNLLDLGWLIFRVGIGISIFLHGLPKIMGSAEEWTMVARAMSNFEINSEHVFWGLLGAL